ncbi:MAG: AAC(3) family N-acetyltransferase [Herpetosiphonaceae bacterium]|nr:MAG: AAC(3) family N-acetyltransferase [Herpetosiphonaceae bacterium]
MSEKEAIERATGGPVMIDSLYADLVALGIVPGMTLLVHSSLSALGWVCGGPVAVILALERALGPGGTLVMPAFSTDLSDPAEWRNPAVPERWWEIIRQTMPAYDPDLTPTRQMGAIPETFRKQRNVLRSKHPQVSFAAWGSQAQQVISDHRLDSRLGEDSPLRRIYDLDGWVLLLGVGHGNNTSIHLAEYRAIYPHKRTIRFGAPTLIDKRRQWTWFEDLDLDDSDFETIGGDFERELGLISRKHVAYGDALLMPQRSLVDYAVQWIEKNRQ